MTVDPKKLKALHDKLKTTELDPAHIVEHCFAAAQTLCNAPPHRTVNLASLVGICAVARTLQRAANLSAEEALLIEAEIETASTRLFVGWEQGVQAMGVRGDSKSGLH